MSLLSSLWRIWASPENDQLEQAFPAHVLKLGAERCRPFYWINPSKVRARNKATKVICLGDYRRGIALEPTLRSLTRHSRTRRHKGLAEHSRQPVHGAR